jgi:hypothetical protein
MMNVGEIRYEPWAGGNIRCVMDIPGRNSCDECVFGQDGGACPERVYNAYPCYHADRTDGNDVHYEKVEI